MDISVADTQAPTTRSVTLRGRFDAHEAPAFRDAIDEAMANGHHDLAVVLADVEFVDSTALAELVRGMKRCREVSGDLALVSPSDPVRVILELTKLDAAFTIR